MNDGPTPSAPASGTVVTRAARVSIDIADGEGGTQSIVLTEEQARAVYSQLRRWYGRNK